MDKYMEFMKKIGLVKIDINYFNRAIVRIEAEMEDNSKKLVSLTSLKTQLEIAEISINEALKNKAKIKNSFMMAMGGYISVASVAIVLSWIGMVALVIDILNILMILCLIFMGSNFAKIIAIDMKNKKNKDFLKQYNYVCDELEQVKTKLMTLGDERRRLSKDVTRCRNFVASLNREANEYREFSVFKRTSENSNVTDLNQEKESHKVKKLGGLK